MQEGEWNFEWSYDKPAAPWAYEMSGHSYNIDSYDNIAVPVSWKLKAKLNEGDEWTLLDEQIDNNQWYGYSSYGYSLPNSTKFDIRVKNQPWQYYRLEVTKKSIKNNNLFFDNIKLLY